MQIILLKHSFAENASNSVQLQYNIQYIQVHISEANLDISKNVLSQQRNVSFIRPTHPEREAKKLFVMLIFDAKSKIKSCLSQIQGEYFPQVSDNIEQNDFHKYYYANVESVKFSATLKGNRDAFQDSNKTTGTNSARRVENFVNLAKEGTECVCVI